MTFAYMNNIFSGRVCEIFCVTAADKEHPVCTGRRPPGMLSRPPAGFSEPLPTASARHWRENTLKRIYIAQVDITYSEMIDWPRQGRHSPRSAHFLLAGVNANYIDNSERGREIRPVGHGQQKPIEHRP